MVVTKIALNVLAGLLIVAAIVTFIIAIWTADDRWGSTAGALGFSAAISAGVSYLIRESGW